MTQILIEDVEGEQLFARLSNGAITGRAIFSFMSGLLMYCDDDPQLSKDERNFFVRLSDEFKGDICAGFCTMYHDFAYFNEKSLISQSEIVRYTDINDFIAALEQLIQILAQGRYDSNVWYESLESDEQFKAFLSAAKALRDHGAEKVRFIVVM